MARFDDLATGPVRIPSLDAYPWPGRNCTLAEVPAYRIDEATGQEDLSWRADWFT